MSIICTRCGGTGWLNTHQIPEKELKEWALTNAQLYDQEVWT